MMLAAEGHQRLIASYRFFFVHFAIDKGIIFKPTTTGISRWFVAEDVELTTCPLIRSNQLIRSVARRQYGNENPQPIRLADSHGLI